MTMVLDWVWLLLISTQTTTACIVPEVCLLSSIVPVNKEVQSRTSSQFLVPAMFMCIDHQTWVVVMATDCWPGGLVVVLHWKEVCWHT